MAKTKNGGQKIYGKKRRSPIRISYPEMDHLDSLKEGINKLVILVCDEIETASTVCGIRSFYGKQLPGADVVTMPFFGSALVILEDRRSCGAQAIYYALRELADCQPFALAIVHHEGCSHGQSPTADEDARDYFRAIDLRDRVPEILLTELDGLRWISVYNIERGGKARFLGRYF